MEGQRRDRPRSLKNDHPNERLMDIDTEKIDEAVLALLYLTMHDGSRTWPFSEVDPKI